jgi:hypothetical protein
MGAPVIITNAVVLVNAVDLSAYCSQVSIEQSIDEVDVTTFGSGGARERIAGIGDGTFSISLFQSWATSAVNDTLDGIVGTSVPVKVKATNAAISATNPEWQFNVLITEWTPMGANAGEVATVDASWPIDGAIVVDITP